MPASPSYKIATIWDSVNLDFLMTSPVPGESIIHCVRNGGAYGGLSKGLVRWCLAVPIEPDRGHRLESAKIGYVIMSEADKQTLMRDFMRRVQAANPSVPEKDVKDYCDKQVESYSPQ
jgi:hypothetical protein